jgi:hypothetical protein
MKELETIKEKFKQIIMPLMIAASFALSACGGVIKDSRLNAPSPELKVTDTTQLGRYFCGVFLNGINTTLGTGTTITHHTLSYTFEGSLEEEFVNDGEQIPTDKCGEITFIGPAPYRDKFDNLQVGGAGFFVPQQVTGTN